MDLGAVLVAELELALRRVVNVDELCHGASGCQASTIS
jgi:hypothetical protein